MPTVPTTSSTNMMRYWSNFAYHGDPNTSAATGTVMPNASVWPEFSNSGNRLEINNTLSVKPGSDTDQICSFWKPIISKKFIN